MPTTQLPPLKRKAKWLDRWEGWTLTFQPFSQADNSITRRFGGTGLGLSITRKLLQLMGSDICLESQPGLGSCFSFELELGVPQKIEESKKNIQLLPKLNAATLKELALPLQDARILVVEDNFINQQIVREFLKKYGMQVVTANHGQEALDLLQDNVFDLILMDIQMPVMDGLEATRRIRADERLKDVQVIAVSAGVTIDEQNLCKRTGMTSFIGKPIDFGNMIDTMVKALENRHEMSLDGAI